MAAPKSGSAETRLQNFVHALEQGNLAPVVRGILGIVVILAVALMYLGWNFRGFSIPAAMDQAQIGREIATGHGWTTRLIRPLAIWQLESNQLPITVKDFPDTFNAPLPPLADALAIKLAGGKVEFKQREIIAPVERFIVAMSMVFFLAAVGVEYLLLRRLFDARLAFWAAVLTLGSDLCWQYTLSGLPQMLMLLIFNSGLYTLARAVEARLALQAAEDGAPVADDPEQAAAPLPARGAVLFWLAATGALFGLLALCHGLSAWLFLGVLIFATVCFRRRGPVLLVLLGAFAIVYAPWIVRSYHVSGSPFGTAIYAPFDTIGLSTPVRMRQVDGPHTADIAPYFFRPRAEFGFVGLMENLLGNMGGNLLAAAFFLSLLHVFRHREVAEFRWAVLVMWLCAAFGMAATGNPADLKQPVAADQLSVLFLPVMLGYGLAFVLVLFSRRTEGSLHPVMRLVLFSVLFLISALPMIFTLLPHSSPPFQYPPYFEPAINKLGLWTRDEEIIGSDMPWAVAWYADRKSLWIPDKLRDFLALSDNGKLNGPLAGMFLTPISRDAPFYSSIYHGEYQEYQQLIFGRTDLPLFPFRQQLLVLGDLSYTFSTDSRRWEKQPPSP